MAGSKVSRCDLLLHRCFDATAIHREWAAGMEVAALRRVERAWQFAFHRLETAFPRFDAWYFGKQRLCVGVIGTPENFLDRRLFYNPAEIHDRDPVGDVFDDAKVMADKEIGQIQLVAQLHEKVDDLRLN